MDSEKTKQVLSDNLVLNLEDNEGAKRIGNIRESLKEIRDEIEELKKCFKNSPEFITLEEYDKLPRIPIDLSKIEEMKDVPHQNSSSLSRSSSKCRVSSKKLADVFLSCNLIEFYTTEQEIPFSCK